MNIPSPIYLICSNKQLNKNKESWLRGIHPQPLCPYAKTKIKFVHYRKVPDYRRKKEKHASYNTAYLVTSFYKSLHPNCYATSDMPKRCAEIVRSAHF